MKIGTFNNGNLNSTLMLGPKKNKSLCKDTEKNAHGENGLHFLIEPNSIGINSDDSYSQYKGTIDEILVPKSVALENSRATHSKSRDVYLKNCNMNYNEEKEKYFVVEEHCSSKNDDIITYSSGRTKFFRLKQYMCNFLIMLKRKIKGTQLLKGQQKKKIFSGPYNFKTRIRILKIICITLGIACIICLLVVVITVIVSFKNKYHIFYINKHFTDEEFRDIHELDNIVPDELVDYSLFE
ncbi:uncharacterized protein SCDLUD_002280 [Saccharomycodes ludwigii]|uniref:uncharacterized protein n=1 Tax=Saccharomycodes ludwigii TaxID=36035 RepID=UPI001E8A73CD|nr:hypothetical protein SCDLUD_002280 [Saccharomycodes ludwigii]KAH3900827.1 hypothetical protein SCDLUD_002280 [Saccharomycodes ludwigii]